MSAPTAEPFSAVARTWLDDQPRADLAYSGWTTAEFASALARKQRSGRLDAIGKARAWAVWPDVSRAMTWADVSPADLTRVAMLVDSGPGLRAGDALPGNRSSP